MTQAPWRMIAALSREIARQEYEQKRTTLGELDVVALAAAAASALGAPEVLPDIPPPPPAPTPVRPTPWAAPVFAAPPVAVAALTGPLDPDELIALPDAATEIGWTPNMIYHRIKAGCVPAQKKGSRLYVYRRDIQAMRTNPIIKPRRSFVEGVWK